jgi:hypothetical protein
VLKLKEHLEASPTEETLELFVKDTVKKINDERLVQEKINRKIRFIENKLQGYADGKTQTAEQNFLKLQA